MTEFDSEHCLNALRGAAGDTAVPDASVRAGTWMRRLVLEQLQPTAVDTAAEQALLTRLREAGAFAGPRRAPPWWRRAVDALSGGDRRWWAVPGLALLALITVRQLPDPAPVPDEGDVMRGAEAPQRIVSERPQQHAAELQALLQAHGVTARLSPQPAGVLQLQARLPSEPERAAVLAQALRQRGIEVPAHGRLFLLIVPATQGKPQGGGG